MTHQELQDYLAAGIESGEVLAIVRDGELLFFHSTHVGEHVTEAEAATAISAEEYRRLSDADWSAPWN